MLKNPKGKGTRLEHKRIKELKKSGFNTVRAGASLGLFDLVAFKFPGPLILSQCKSNGCSKKERAGIISFRNAPMHSILELAVWKDYKGWKFEWWIVGKETNRPCSSEVARVFGLIEHPRICKS